MAGRSRGRRKGGHEAEHADERWLLTYADLITLLMALFMVLFSMSVVNKSKVAALQESLHNAFSPHILPGGNAIKRTGGDAEVKTMMPEIKPPARSSSARRDDRQLRELKQEVDKEAKAMGLSKNVQTRVTERGLVIDILTDNLLFASGQAQIKPPGMELLGHLAPLLSKQRSRAVQVEGHTDSMPIRGSSYPSNWELSTARASAVVRALIAMNLRPTRLTATGRANLDPSASNATESGRARNRRVELVLPRRGS
jgi:chemotaxis protein MotB